MLAFVVFAGLIVAGATRPVGATGGPGTPTASFAPLAIPEDGLLHATPGGVMVQSGDVVFYECKATCDPFNPTYWSEVLRFDDNPTAARAPCWQFSPGTCGLVSHYQLFSECDDSDTGCTPPASGFKDEFTGFVTGVPELSGNRILHTEDLVGDTRYNVLGADYIIQSDSVSADPGPHIGGVATPISKLMLLGPYIGLAFLIAAVSVVGVFYTRRSKPRRQNNRTSTH